VTVVLGLDPGSTIGVCVLDVGAHQASLVSATCWNEDADEILSSKLRELLWQSPRPELVAIERVYDVHGSARMGSSYAQGLALSNWIGGLLAGVARSQGVRVVTPPAGTWRKALCGSPRATDAQVKQMVRLRVPDWPARSNAHERDGAGVALWAGLGAARSAA